MKSRIIDLIKGQWLFVLITATIICSGLFVPRIILSFKSNSNIIAKGRVDAAEIQPYGADVIMKEQYLSSCVDFLMSRLFSLGTGEGDDGLANWYELSDCNISRVGRISWNRAIDGDYNYPIPAEGFGLTQDILNMTADCFHTHFIGDQILQQASEYNDRSGIPAVYYVSNRTDTVAMEPHTGIPVMIDVKFVSDTYEDIEQYCTQVVSAYSEATGIRFVEELPDYRYDYVDGYDMTISRGYRSSDGRFIVSVAINSGWYWTYDPDIGEWQATDQYLWNVMVNISEE